VISATAFALGHIGGLFSHNKSFFLSMTMS